MSSRNNEHTPLEGREHDEEYARQLEQGGLSDPEIEEMLREQSEDYGDEPEEECYEMTVSEKFNEMMDQVKEAEERYGDSKNLYDIAREILEKYEHEAFGDRNNDQGNKGGRS